jgi:hypothetical protein
MTRTAFLTFGALALAAVVAAPGCSSSGTKDVSDTFSDLAGKDDSLSKKKIELVGSLDYGQTSDPVAYSNPPRYRAFKFGGQKGDQVDIRVRSQDGDAVAWLLDNNYNILARNDDADGTLDSHITATLPGNSDPSIITYLIVFRDAWLLDATFTVQLDGKVDLFSCSVDADCVAISVGGCCPNGTKIAVNANDVDAYNAQHACTNPRPICPLFVINDTRVPECDNATHECVLVKPTDIVCGSFIKNSHECAPGYQCDFAGHVPDVGGKCVCEDAATLGCANYQHVDPNSCSCVDNPFCGGIANIPCSDPNFPRCIDDPRDTCDPASGGADCGGICAPACFQNVLCVQGSHWDGVACKCVPSCVDKIDCLQGTHWDGVACKCVPS